MNCFVCCHNYLKWIDDLPRRTKRITHRDSGALWRCMPYLPVTLMSGCCILSQFPWTIFSKLLSQGPGCSENHRFLKLQKTNSKSFKNNIYWGLIVWQRPYSKHFIPVLIPKLLYETILLSTCSRWGHQGKECLGWNPSSVTYHQGNLGKFPSVLSVRCRWS